MRKMMILTLATASLALSGAAGASTVAAKQCHDAKGRAVACQKMRHVTKVAKVVPAKTDVAAVHKTTVTTTTKKTS